jgi:clumping factor A
MIVASLLLILVAVTLLVLGLAGGSSTLLISSIVASLLAAVALVVGARHAAAQRRAGGPDGRPTDPTADDPDLADLTDFTDLTAEPAGAGTRADRYAAAGAGRSTGRPFTEPTSEGHLPDGPASDGAISDTSGVADFGDAGPVSGDLDSDQVDFGRAGDRSPGSAADRSTVTERDGSDVGGDGFGRLGDGSDLDGPDSVQAEHSDEAASGRVTSDAGAAEGQAGADSYPGSADVQAEDGVHGDPHVGSVGVHGDPHVGSVGVHGDSRVGSAGLLGDPHVGSAGVQGGGGSRATSDFSGSEILADDLVGSDHASADARRDRVSGPSRAASDFSSSADLREDSAAFADRQDADEAPHGHPDRSRPADPDYDRASTVIGAARSTEPPNAPWHHDPLRAGEAAEPSADAFADPGPSVSSPGRGSSEPDYLSPPTDHLSQPSDQLGPPADHLGPPADRLDPSADHSVDPFVDHSVDPSAGHSGRPVDHLGRPADYLSSPAGRGTSGPDYLGDLLGSDIPDSGGAAAAGPGFTTREFDEPDDEDPADEPLPQAVRPGDAVRVAQLDAEVVVVDGRPRYHMTDCGHLAGRLSEPLPVREAVELGFSPCGQCRPVDRLVAEAARR